MRKLIYLIVLILFTGCLGSKSISNKESVLKQSEITVKQSDSVSHSNTNQEIKDIVTIEVPVSDPEMDKKIDDILSKLNTQKRSGSNNYKLSYDRIKRELVAELSIGETTTKETVTNKSELTEKSLEERTDEYIKKKIVALPWWLYLAVFIFFLPKIIRFASNFIPGIATMKIFSGFFK